MQRKMLGMQQTTMNNWHSLKCTALQVPGCCTAFCWSVAQWKLVWAWHTSCVLVSHYLALTHEITQILYAEILWRRVTASGYHILTFCSLFHTKCIKWNLKEACKSATHVNINPKAWPVGLVICTVNNMYSNVSIKTQVRGENLNLVQCWTLAVTKNLKNKIIYITICSLLF